MHETYKNIPAYIASWWINIRRRYITSVITGIWFPERGQNMTEYGLLTALLAIAAIAVLLLIAPKLQATYHLVLNALGTASNSSGIHPGCNVHSVPHNPNCP